MHIRAHTHTDTSHSHSHSHRRHTFTLERPAHTCAHVLGHLCLPQHAHTLAHSHCHACSRTCTLTWCVTALSSATQARPFQGQGTWKAPTLLRRLCDCHTVRATARCATLSPWETSESSGARPHWAPGPWAVLGWPGWLEMQEVLSCWVVGAAGGLRSLEDRGLQQEAGARMLSPSLATETCCCWTRQGPSEREGAPCRGLGFLPVPEAACSPVSPTGGWAGRAGSLGELGAGRPGILPGPVQGPRQWVRGQMAPVATGGPDTAAQVPPRFQTFTTSAPRGW